MITVPLIKLFMSFMVGVIAGKSLPDGAPEGSKQALLHCVIDKMEYNMLTSKELAKEECLNER